MRSKKLTIPLVLQELDRLYDPPKTFLRFRTPLDLLVVTILSAQCTDARVNLVSRTLFRKYRTVDDYLGVPRRALERDIHSCGTYRTKSRYIQNLCAILKQKHKGRVPHTMEELLELPGVGRKTASVVLSAAFNKHEGIAVDTHVLRVSRRLKLSQGKTPETVERDLMRHTPRERWGDLTTLLISHGRGVCTARNRSCNRCVFRNFCPSSRTRGKADLAKKS